MHPEIEKLIDLALADGQVTEKERNVILKKAVELRVDADEVEMVLDGRLHQLAQNKNVKVQIQKCLSCGNFINGLSNVCDACGYINQSSSTNTSNLNDLHNNINLLETLIVKLKSQPKPSIFWKILKLIIIYNVFLWSMLLIMPGNRITSLVVVSLFSLIYVFVKRYRNITILGIDLNKIIPMNSFEKLLSECESQSRVVKVRYGDDIKIKNLLDELNHEILNAKRVREKQSRNVNFGCLGLILLIIVFYIIIYLVNYQKLR
jgi:hypothetical protein